ncbi:glycosyltransferase [Candidatus Saccharibacteria bacterium]|nr:glycosyltransferase [Candidatus Saccharibacteria bacterium]
MRIAIASDTYTPMTNGVAVFTSNLAHGLARKGHDVILFIPSTSGKKHTKILEDGKLKEIYLSSKRFPFYPDQIHKIPEEKKFLGVKMPRVAYKNGMWMATKPYREMKKALDKFKPEILHSQQAGTIGIAAAHYARKKNIPFVSTGHSYPDNYTDQFKLLRPVKKPADAIVKAYLTNYMKNGQYATMPTEMAIHDLAPERSRRFRVTVTALSNGIDLSQYYPAKPDSKICKKYNINPNKLRVVYIGRVDPEKSINIVIDAYAKIAKQFPDSEFVIVGDGIARNDLEKEVKERGLEQQIRFLGKIMPPETVEIYRSGTLFATASETETQGIVLIEAAAVGLPLVAVDAGAVKELCQNKKNGILCKPGDVDGIARAMKKILSDKKLQASLSAGSVEISKKHDLNYTLNQFIEIYKKAIDSAVCG